jgi:hypothetical protein
MCCSPGSAGKRERDGKVLQTLERPIRLNTA